MTENTARRHKAFAQVAFKAEGDDAGDGSKLGPGEFIATAAVFGNVDTYGDRMMPGAFTDTLNEWAASGNVLSVIFQHNWSDPFANIGAVKSITETAEALVYRGQLDLDDDYSMKVYKLMKGRRITQQSFGFDILDASEVMEDGKSIFEIRKVHLYEVGPCLVGVNQATQLLDIKSSGTPAAPAAGVEPSGQEKPAASDEKSSVTPDAESDSPASKSLSPASVMLALEIQELLGDN